MNKNKFLLGVLALFGIYIVYAGFKIWTGFIMPNLFNIKNLPIETFYIFAAIAGFISFFAPCAIGILPAYAAYYLELKEKRTKSQNRFFHALSMGVMAAAGIIVLYVILGAILVALGTSAAAYFTLSKPIIAAILIVIGVALLADMNFKKNHLYNIINKKLIKGKAKNSIFFFGVLYGAAALGCAMLVFVPLVIIPLSTGSALIGTIAFVIYSLAFGLAMIITTLLVAYSKNLLVDKIATSSKLLKRITGVVLILSAIYLLYYYLRFRM